MKNTIKRFSFAAAIIFIFFAQQSYAQDSRAWRLGISANPGIGMKDPFGFVLGGDLRLQKDFTGPVSAILTTGFTHFFPKDEFKTGSDDPRYNVIPVKAGIKVFATKHFYINAEAGAGFSTDEGTKASFVWSPAIGWAFQKGFDVGVKYEDFTKYSTTKQLALRVAYGFNLSK